MRKTAVITILICLILLSACAPKRVSIELNRADYYLQQFEQIYSEYEALQNEVYKGATPEQREVRAALKARFLALWQTMQMDLRLDDDSLTTILNIIARLPL